MSSDLDPVIREARHVQLGGTAIAHMKKGLRLQAFFK
jgi:hypothetical protein